MRARADSLLPVLGLVLLSAAAAVMVVMPREQTRAASAAGGDSTAWIGLPESGTDVTSVELRTAFIRATVSSGGAADFEAAQTSFAGRCGRVDDASETYVATIGDAVLRRHARVWRVTLQVHGDMVETRTRNATYLPAAPPPPPTRGQARLPWAADPPEATKPVWFEKKKLQDIADAWRLPDTWQSPQGPIHCLDGGVARLEACVHGRYAIRDRSCDGGAPALWQAIQNHLSPATQHHAAD